MPLFSQAAVAAYPSLSWTENRCLETLRRSSALAAAAASPHKQDLNSRLTPARRLATHALYNVHEVQTLVSLCVSPHPRLRVAEQQDEQMENGHMGVFCTKLASTSDCIFQIHVEAH